MTDHSYDWWHKAMAGGKIGSKDLPVADGQPQPGYYRRRFERGGQFVPVAIFAFEGELVAVVDGKQRDAADHWLHCAMHPISEDTYNAFMETRQWPDVAPEVSSVVQPEAPIGAEEETLEQKIEKAKEGVERYAKIEDEDAAKQAQTLRSSLLSLANDADKIRKAEKQPHLDAGRAVDQRWNPIRDSARAGANAIRKALDVFATAQAKQHTEERKNTPPPVQIKGGSGRAAAIKVVKVITEITDQDALYAFLKEHAELKELMRNLAQRAVNAGHDVPGVKVEEQRKVA